MTSPAVSESEPGISDFSPAADARGVGVTGGSGVGESVRASGARVWLSAVLRWLPRAVGVVVVCWAVGLGLASRSAAFDSTSAVRFRGDIQNALNQSARVLRYTGLKPVEGQALPLGAVLKAWVSTYDRVYARGAPHQRFDLDYTPTRLLVVTLWTRDLWADRGVVRTYDDSMAAPLLRINTACALVSATGMFLLVRRLLAARRSLPADSTDPLALHDAWALHRPWVLALLSGLLVWFSPALLVNAHVFPQWDVWLMPFFVFACYFALLRQWIVVGVLVALGAMLKGQILVVAPMLAVWALCSGPAGTTGSGGRVRRLIAGTSAGLGNLLRLGVGLLVGTVLVVWPWLARSPEVWEWAGLASAAAVATGLAGLAVRRMWRGRLRWAAVALLLVSGATFVLAVAYPLPDARVPGSWFVPTVLGAGAVALVALLTRPLGALPAVVLGCVGGAVLLGGFRYDGSWSWFEVGFRFPTNNYLALVMGPTANLPAILQHGYQWNLLDPVSGVNDLPLRSVLRVVYFALLVPVGIAAARAARTSDPKLLVCLTVPWLAMFALLPQMHERYLLWAAMMSAGAVALGGVRGAGMLAAHLGITVFAVACVGSQVLAQDGGYWPEATRALGGMIPGGGWGVLMLLAVLLAVVFGRSENGVGWLGRRGGK